MKKLFTLALAALMACGAAQAQKAFRQVGVSLEAGTTGVGANLSLPVVSNHLILTVGYNFPSFTISQDFSLNSAPITSYVNEANQTISYYNGIIAQYPEQASQHNMSALTPIDNVSEINTTVDATVNFGNFKALLEFYPTKKSAFHITAGVFYGSDAWLDIAAKVDQAAWGTYTKAVEQNKLIPNLSKDQFAPNMPNRDIHPIDGLESAAKFNINDKTFVLSPDSGGKLDAKLKIQKLKPYLGIGFGSSVPTKKRMGFQMELGAYYQGKPELVSDQEMPFFDSNAYGNTSIDDLVDLICKLQWYPQLTFRWTGRIF